MTQQSSSPSWIGQTVGGRYEIEALLGQGGMSAVYKATDPNLQRTVAVKLIHAHLSTDEEFVRRFEAEAAAVAQLRHSNIIQVYDFNHDDNLYYMVLEFVPGETLQERLQSLNDAGQRLSLEEIVKIIATICDAVNYAHDHGMIHRDLKPANVMLNLRDQPILMDFGVAKMLGAVQHTATGAIIGTAKYMSPEQARGNRPDERTDIYSLGVMLYEMVAGEPPFDAETTVALLMKHVTEPVPDIHSITQDVPESIVNVIKKALAKDRTDRYQTADDMAAALRTSLMVSTMPQPAVPEATMLSVDPAETLPAGAVALAGDTLLDQPLPSQTGGLPLTLPVIGAIAAVLILILGVSGYFLFSGSDEGRSPDEGDNGGVAVASDGTPQTLPSPENMIRIPEGSYTVGVDVTGDNYAPIQQVDLKEFWIDQYEVANEDFGRFVAETGHAPPPGWSGNIPPTDQERHPVDGINWDTAVAYCAWANKRLPTEAEWEVAARGTEGRLFPWGNKQNVVPLPQSGTYPIGGKPTNQSSFGVFDMAGNVWEWVGNSYSAIDEDNRILRGGANGFLQNMAYRLQGNPNTPTMVATAGIRCASSKVASFEVVALAEDVLASDNFSDPGSGWPILTEGSYLFGYHPPAFYHVQVNATNDSTVVTRDPTLKDFTVETKVQVASFESEAGNFRYGLAFRRSANDRYYAFVISPRTGIWYILLRTSTGLETLLEGETGDLRGLAPPGFSPDSSQIDTLRIDAKGARFIFHVNDEPIARLSDSTYDSGEIGFFVENFDETLSHIHYDSFTIREVDFDDAIAASLAPEDTPPPPDTPAPPPATEASPPTESAKDAASPTATPTEAEPSSTPEAEATATDTPTPAPSPTPTPSGPNLEDMTLIDANFFNMGSAQGQAIEGPVHLVLLDGYYLDTYEVTNVQYRACVEAGACTPANAADSFTYRGYRDSPAYDDYPVVSVNWDQADDYCEWSGKRLPTEAEWEYAARGPLEYTWPWGNSFDPSLSAASAKDVQPVGSYPQGVSPLGIYDMAGNAAEWVADTFDEAFYGNSPPKNPVNLGPGNGRTYRGGSFDNLDGIFFTSTRRYGNARSFSEVDVGFRCAAEANSPASQALTGEFCALFATSKPGVPCP